MKKKHKTTVAIPAAARPALRWIRALVKRPSRPVVMEVRVGERSVPVFEQSNFLSEGGSCPLGLLPSATSERPQARDCGILDPREYRALKAFGKWWDGLSLDAAKSAIDVIWPEKQKRGAR